MLKLAVVTALVALSVAAPATIIADGIAPNGVECVLCEFVMKEVDSLIGQNATEQEIEKALDDVCGILPKSIQSECEALVQQYAPQIIQLLLQHLDPTQICTDLGLCKNSTLVFTATVVDDEKTDSPNGVECVLCEFVMKELDSLLGQNATEQEIEKALDEVCSILPKSIQGECQALVQQYGPQIIQLLLQHLDPTTICTKLGLCKSGEVLETPFVGNSTECVLCEFVLKELDSLLEKNATVQDVEKALDKVCDLLPKTISGLCENLVQQYGPNIVQALEKLLDPTKVCTEIGLCKNSTETAFVTGTLSLPKKAVA